MSQRDSQKYKAELYDEVWQKARDMGFDNVTMALSELATLRARLTAAPVQQVSVPDEREAFETWGETLFFSACFERHGSDEYAGRGLQGAWLGWQARAALNGGLVAGKSEPMTVRLGNFGKAFDGPGEKRAYTYNDQPGNVAAWRLGVASRGPAHQKGGDHIDFGLGLLLDLQEQGFGVFEIADKAPDQGSRHD